MSNLLLTFSLGFLCPALLDPLAFSRSPPTSSVHNNSSISGNYFKSILNTKINIFLKKKSGKCERNKQGDKNEVFAQKDYLQALVHWLDLVTTWSSESGCCIGGLRPQTAPTHSKTNCAPVDCAKSVSLTCAMQQYIVAFNNSTLAVFAENCFCKVIHYCRDPRNFQCHEGGSARVVGHIV